MWMRLYAAAFVALVVVGCSSSEPSTGSSELRDDGCAYPGCTRGNDIGVCPRDQPNFCYCTDKGGPSDCRATAVVPDAPYKKAICCR